MIGELIATFLIGVGSSIIGAIAGGGGLISVPFLLFLGLPPQVAIATNKFGSVGLSAGATVQFIRAKKIVWKYVLPFTIVAVLGGIVGARILISIDDVVLERVIGILLLVLVPMLYLKKEIGTVNKQSSNLSKTIGFVVYFLIMVFGGFFGAGTGVLVFYTLMYFFGFTIIEANATDIIPWFFSALGALFLFMLHGIVRYDIGFALFLGMLVGGSIGARLAIKKGDVWVRGVFVLVVIGIALNILFL